ncbi:hypothetical protein [Pseudonocardia xishanensis]
MCRDGVRRALPAEPGEWLRRSSSVAVAAHRGLAAPVRALWTAGR